MSALTATLSSALLHFIWQGVVVAGLLWLALFILRQRSAATRYAVSCCALAVLAVLPLVTMIGLYESRVSLSAGESIAVITPPVPSSTSAAPGAFRAPWLAWAQSWILTAWAIGVLLFSLRIVWGCKYIYALKRRGEVAGQPVLEVVERLAGKMGIQRRVRVLMSSIADGPSVVGWLRPLVLLPASSILGLSPEQLEAVVAHELAHIRRHDYLVSAIQVIVETLLFYHPAVWWTSSRIRHERELCCDDLAVRACGDAMCYARALTRLEKLRVVKPGMVLGVTDGPLLYRIQRIIGDKTMKYGPSKLSGVLVVLVALVGLAVNFSWARPESRAPQVSENRVHERNATSLETQDQPGVSINLGAASVLHRTRVEYPEAAVAKGVQGTVTVEAASDSTGNVVDARVLSGPSELRRTALQSVLEWHFVPTGSASMQVVHISFDLDARKKAEKEIRTEPVATADVARAQEKLVEEQRQKRAEFELRAEKKEDAVVRSLRANTEAEAKVREQDRRRLAQVENAAQYSEAEEKAKEQAHVRKLQSAPEQERDVEARRKLETEFAETRKILRATVGPSRVPLTNRVLSAINIVGLPEQSRLELLSRINLHVGDTLSNASVERAGLSVREFDEHLEFRLVPTENNGATLEIFPPGSGGLEGYRILGERLMMLPRKAVEPSKRP